MQEVWAECSDEVGEIFYQARRRREEAQNIKEAGAQPAPQAAPLPERTARLQAMRTQMIENVFTRSCGSCKFALGEWDGCMAVECGTAACKRNHVHCCGACDAYFVGHSASADAHAHASRCEHVQAYAIAPGDYFVAPQDIVKAQNSWRVAKMREMTADWEPHDARLLLHSLRREARLHDLDLARVLPGLHNNQRRQVRAASCADVERSLHICICVHAYTCASTAFESNCVQYKVVQGVADQQAPAQRNRARQPAVQPPVGARVDRLPGRPIHQAGRQARQPGGHQNAPRQLDRALQDLFDAFHAANVLPGEHDGQQAGGDQAAPPRQPHAQRQQQRRQHRMQNAEAARQRPAMRRAPMNTADLIFGEVLQSVQEATQQGAGPAISCENMVLRPLMRICSRIMADDPDMM